MLKNRKRFVILLFVSMIVAGVGTSSWETPDRLYKNLEVLPKDISSKELQGLMVDDFQDGLGVTCSFCHVDAKEGHGLDYAADGKPEKEIAREMMRMTMGLNKKYFKLKKPILGSKELVVSCFTCHRGVAFPDEGGMAK